MDAGYARRTAPRWTSSRFGTGDAVGVGVGSPACAGVSPVSGAVVPAATDAAVASAVATGAGVAVVVCDCGLEQPAARSAAKKRGAKKRRASGTVPSGDGRLVGQLFVLCGRIQPPCTTMRRCAARHTSHAISANAAHQPICCANAPAYCAGVMRPR